jgi:cytoskeletal protein RodZ
MAFNEDLLRDYALMITSGYLAYDLLLCIAVRITFAGVTDPFWRPKTQRRREPKLEAKPVAVRPQQLQQQQQQQQTTASEASDAASSSPSPSTTPPAPSASPLLPSVCGVSSPRAPADGVDPSADDEGASSSAAAAVAPAPPPVRIDDALTLLHHVLIIGAFSGGVALHIGTFFMSCFLLNEASTLPLNLNWLLACMRAAGLWGGGRESTVSRISVDGTEQLRHPPPSLSLSARFYAALYKANGVVLLMLFLLLRVLFNVCVLAAMVLTWWSLRPLWLGRSASSSSDSNDSSSTTGSGGVGESEPAPMTPLHISQCAVLSALAAGHVLINVLWAAALVKAVRRKLCGKGSTPAHKSKQSKAA